MPDRRALLGALGLLAAPALLRSPALAQAEMPRTGKRDWSAQVPTLRVGLLGGENESDRLGRYDGYRKLLEQTFAVPVPLFPLSWIVVPLPSGLLAPFMPNDGALIVPDELMETVPAKSLLGFVKAIVP